MDVLRGRGGRKIIWHVTDEQSAASRDESRPPLITRIGVDWWATIIAGVIAVLAVADVLPKIAW
ncbi:hypothetical protein FZI91_01665 [Mycobacterium sp. CBMA271]|nr:hypothetical protein [Mycobacteroides sp. CBMA 326]MUM20416.1 hypothetical protein [Mycobacteroides sp. CBMA 271]